MEWLDRMNRAVDCIENSLEDKTDYEAIARAACCSVYHFQRIFSFITDIPLSEYIRRRRMTMAAFELQNTAIKVVDLAIKYGYDSPEAFTRAFQLFHGISPSQARRRGVTLKAFPRISFQITVKGAIELNYRIEKKEAFQVYGIERIFDPKDGKNFVDIPKFWDEILGSGEHRKLEESTGADLKNMPPKGKCLVNAVCSYRQEPDMKFPYMICADKTAGSNTEGYTELDVPAATWAIFRTESHPIGETPEKLQKMIGRVYAEWLPVSKYALIEGYDFENYYYEENNLFYEEYCIRVEPKG